MYMNFDCLCLLVCPLCLLSARLVAAGEGVVVVSRLARRERGGRGEGGVVVEPLRHVPEHGVLVLLLAVPLERTLCVGLEEPLHGGVLLRGEQRAPAREEEAHFGTEARGGEAEGGGGQGAAALQGAAGAPADRAPAARQGARARGGRAGAGRPRRTLTLE